jgi:hypothetical protein
MTGVAKGTVLKLLVDTGATALGYQTQVLRNLTCRRLQCDEIWAFCYAKERNIPEEHRGRFGVGDVWTWTAIDAETKLIPCWRVGRRSALDAEIFMRDLASRLLHGVQVTTDGHAAYLNAVKGGFGFEVDYATLVKLYGTDPESERRYSPAKCVGSMREVIRGNPQPISPRPTRSGPT